MYKDLYDEGKGDFAFHLFFENEFSHGVSMLLCDVNLSKEDTEEWNFVIFVSEFKAGIGFDRENAIGIKINETVSLTSDKNKNNPLYISVKPWLIKNLNVLREIYSDFVNNEEYETHFHELQN